MLASQEAGFHRAAAYVMHLYPTTLLNGELPEDREYATVPFMTGHMEGKEYSLLLLRPCHILTCMFMHIQLCFMGGILMKATLEVPSLNLSSKTLF